jgi:hypothetical protein
MTLRRAIASARIACEHMRPKGFIVCAGLPVAELDDLHYVESEAKGRDLFGSGWTMPPSCDDIAVYLTTGDRHAEVLAMEHEDAVDRRLYRCGR